MKEAEALQHDLGVSTDLDVIDHYLDFTEARIVDIGCGNMALSKAMAKRGANVLGIDPDPVQALKNQQSEAVEGVSFAQAGAQEIPVDDTCIDGIVFPYSLHHVPEEFYPAAFKEIFRVLKPDGFVYVIEPVASGNLNEVMRLFHDEQRVRQSAQAALDTLAIPHFRSVTIAEYKIPIKYGSWEEYASRYASKSYNTAYTEEQVRAEHVKQRFIELGTPTDFSFESPMRVTYCRHCLS